MHFFNTNPRVGVCGGYGGANLSLPQAAPVSRDLIEHYRRHPDCTSRGEYSWPGIVRYTVLQGANLAAPTFVDQVNRAPMFVRPDCYDAVGRFDESFAPFQCDDKELCIRAWRGGWQVVLYTSGAVMHGFEGGMRRLSLDRRVTQSYRNHLRLYELHGDFISSGGHVALEWGRGVRPGRPAVDADRPCRCGGGSIVSLGVPFFSVTSRGIQMKRPAWNPGRFARNLHLYSVR